MTNIERRVRAIFGQRHDLYPTREAAIEAAAKKFLLNGRPDGGILDLPEKKEDQPPATSK